MNDIDLNQALSLIEKIDTKERPLWVRNLLEEMNSIVDLPRIHSEVVAISQTPETYKNGKALFSEIRKQTNKSKSDIDEGIFCLLENSAKTIFNASDTSVPFDADSSAWILLNLSFVVEKSGIEKLRDFYENVISKLQ